MVKPRDFVVDLYQVDHDDEELLGVTASKLGKLHQYHVPVKRGFVVTSQAFHLFLKANNLDQKIRHLLGTANFEEPHSVYQVSLLIRKLINTADIPSDIAHDILSEYKRMSGFWSSATVGIQYSVAPSLQNFIKNAETQVSIAHVNGDSRILTAVRHAWAAFVSPHIVFERQHILVEDLVHKVSLVIQHANNPQVAGTIEVGKEVLTIKALYGPFDRNNPGIDEIMVDKKTLQIQEQIHRIQESKSAIHDQKQAVGVSSFMAKKPKLNLRDIHELSLITHVLDSHAFSLQEIDWIREDGKLYITHIVEHSTAIALSVPPAVREIAKEITDLPTHHVALGDGMTKTVGVGRIRTIRNKSDLSKIRKGDVIILPVSFCNQFDEIKRASGIIFEHSVSNSPFRYFIRLSQIPTIMNVSNATKILKDGDVVTIHAKKGTIIRGSMMIHNIF